MTLFFVNMPVFNNEDHVLISELHKLMGYGTKRLVREFPSKVPFKNFYFNTAFKE